MTHTFEVKKKNLVKQPNIMNPIKIPCLDVDTEF